MATEDQKTTAAAANRGVKSEDDAPASTTIAAAPSASTSPNDPADPDEPVDEGVIDHPTASGFIDEKGKFNCDCGARPIINARRYITSHLSDKHRPGSMYAEKHQENPRVCGRCQEECGSYHKFESHIRSRHNFRGETEAIWKRWRETESGDTILFDSHRDEPSAA